VPLDAVPSTLRLVVDLLVRQVEQLESSAEQARAELGPAEYAQFEEDFGPIGVNDDDRVQEWIRDWEYVHELISTAVWAATRQEFDAAERAAQRALMVQTKWFSDPMSAEWGAARITAAVQRLRSEVEDAARRAREQLARSPEEVAAFRGLSGQELELARALVRPFSETLRESLLRVPIRLDAQMYPLTAAQLIKSSSELWGMLVREDGGLCGRIERDLATHDPLSSPSATIACAAELVRRIAVTEGRPLPPPSPVPTTGEPMTDEVNQEETGADDHAEVAQGAVAPSGTAVSALDDFSAFVRLVVGRGPPRDCGLVGNRASVIQGDLYCPRCGAARKMDVRIIHPPQRTRSPGFNYAGDVVAQLMYTVFQIRCRQCPVQFTALVYPSHTGPTHVLLPNTLGGIRTPHTPEGVAFYLDQAARSHALGANSAAVAMYRGALEHILFDAGYTKGMLNAKVQALETDIAKGSGPQWAHELDTEFLHVVKDLGNGAIHPNDGDVKKQAALDRELLSQLQGLFAMLLFLIYEVPHQKAALKNDMRARAALLKK
jgi:hypothetical protein